MKIPAHKQQPSKGSKTKKRLKSIEELPQELQKAIENMKVSYTVKTVAEHIHPKVKAQLEEEKKKRKG